MEHPSRSIISRNGHGGCSQLIMINLISHWLLWGYITSETMKLCPVQILSESTNAMHYDKCWPLVEICFDIHKFVHVEVILCGYTVNPLYNGYLRGQHWCVCCREMSVLYKVNLKEYKDRNQLWVTVLVRCLSYKSVC